MKITITARNTTAKEPFTKRVEKKLEKLDRFFDDQAEASVTLTNEGGRETVEVTIKSKGMFYRTEKTTDDRMDSLEAAVDALVRQIVKNKSRLEKRLRATAFDEPMQEDIPGTEEGFHVVKVKRFAFKPMHVEEAILQMNMLGHAFYIYRNAQSGEVNVVYKRRNGDYGLIEPDDLMDD